MMRKREGAYLSISIYIATNKKTNFPLDIVYKPIQVGALATDELFAQLNDMTGESIADKNQYYCELTALYWVWKNQPFDDIIGLCHYRRFFYLNNTHPKLVRKIEYSMDSIEYKIM